MATINYNTSTSASTSETPGMRTRSLSGSHSNPIRGVDHGQLLQAYEPEKEAVYNAFTAYFNNPVLTKVKDVDGYSMYMTKTHCLLNRQCRYIIVLVEKDNERTGNRERLEDSRWISLQTRELDDNHDLPPHAYQAVAKGDLVAEIKRVDDQPSHSSYTCDKFPIEITILKEAEEFYQEKGTIVSALETWKTIVMMK